MPIDLLQYVLLQLMKHPASFWFSLSQGTRPCAYVIRVSFSLDDPDSESCWTYVTRGVAVTFYRFPSHASVSTTARH